MKALIVAAHPDDEIIFFGGVLRALLDRGSEVELVAATGEFGDEALTRTRQAEFRRLGRRLGVGTATLGLADTPLALSVEAIVRGLTATFDPASYDDVYTHGVFGEYGHQHHIDVCTAVHRWRSGVRSLAGPLRPDETLVVDLDWKRAVAAEIYPSQGFAASWCSSIEAFVRLNDEQVAILSGLIPRPGSGSEPYSWPRLAHLADDAIAALRTGVAFPDVENVPERIWKPAAERWLARLRSLRGSEDGLDEDLGPARAHPAHRLGTPSKEGP